MKAIPKIDYFWKKEGFKPNENQSDAILYSNGPLFLTAGPGSGKTRVLLWHTLNLLVYKGVDPSRIFLSTFTEKAALQLKEGLRSLLATVTNETGKPFDITPMSIGTVHSICQKLLTDRRFAAQSTRRRSPVLLDELGQYFMVYNRRNWVELINAANFDDEEATQREINKFFTGSDIYSRHLAVQNCLSFFNRLSEEKIDPKKIKTKDEMLKALLTMYAYYKDNLLQSNKVGLTDFSLLQQEAYSMLSEAQKTGDVFEHVIIDEYQDTNAIQELIFFTLAKGHKNICVVGDDDQALYRFRGATVENLVRFEERCKNHLDVKPHRINLNINYRSRKRIVDFYLDFITRIDWAHAKNHRKYYRLIDKEITPDSKDRRAAVLVSGIGKPEDVCTEIAQFIKKLKAEKKVEDYSQIALLFPAMKSWQGKNTRVQKFQDVFDREGIPYYAPRAGRFLEVEEAKDICGIFLEVFGSPKNKYRGKASQGIREFQDWMAGCKQRAEELIGDDKGLKEFIAKRAQEAEVAAGNYELLVQYFDKKKTPLDGPYLPGMSQQLSTLGGLSIRTQKALSSYSFNNIVKRRASDGNPFTINYALNRVTSLDWNVLDLFYQLGAFEHFRKMYDLAENGEDEGPICNLGLITQYLARFIEETSPVITGQFLTQDRFVNKFFSSYLYAIFRLGETEYEDPDDPFPKGRVPFMTVHQAKGLEFPVVVLGSTYRSEGEASKVECTIRDILGKEGEPREKIGEFDNTRMFYVALSRAESLLILPRFKGQGQRVSEPFKTIFAEDKLPAISSFNRDTLAKEQIKDNDLGKSYSYTGDYMLYNKCPRNYMIFRKYDFVPSRSQTMFFGSLVHETVEDLHHLLMEEREKGESRT